jgi:TolA-binding protein
MMKVKFWSCLAILMMGSMLTWQATAQEKKPAKDARGPLPAHYGKLGLSDEQKDGMYQVHDEYKSQIDALSAQIKKLMVERDTKLQEKLTASQKTRLQELRDEAARKSAEAKAKSDANAKVEKAAKGTEAKPAETKKP